MNKLALNKPVDLSATIQTIVRQSFPFATPSVTTLNATEKEYRTITGVVTSRMAGTKRERFVWGSSVVGGSRLVG